MGYEKNPHLKVCFLTAPLLGRVPHLQYAFSYSFDGYRAVYNNKQIQIKYVLLDPIAYTYTVTAVR